MWHKSNYDWMLFLILPTGCFWAQTHNFVFTRQTLQSVDHKCSLFTRTCVWQQYNIYCINLYIFSKYMYINDQFFISYIVFKSTRTHNNYRQLKIYTFISKFKLNRKESSKPHTNFRMLGWSKLYEH